MTSRLANLCDKLLEAGWLAALIVAPLFFNVYSSRVFEPDKATLVRSLALVMASAWIIRQIERGGIRAFVPTRAHLRANPLLSPTLALVLVYILATIFSVAANVSLWGSYQRLQGTYTTFAYIVIFLIAASTLRTRVQLDRALNTILLTSLPIAVYGLVQHFRLDPLPWAGDTVERIAANMGNSIFVAAYLIMVVPIALARWIETMVRAARATPKGRVFIGVTVAALLVLVALWTFDFALGALFALVLLAGALGAARLWAIARRDALLTATYTLILAAQFVAILFTQSRGPWLGLAGGLFAFVVLYALAHGARRVMLAVIVVAAIAAVLLGVFNLPLAPLEPLKRVPYIGRLGQMLETDTGTGKVRELIWQGAVQLVLPHAPLWSPTTGEDALNPIRPLIGYGPEAMYVAFNPFYPPELGNYEARNASPDRSHNETFDMLVMTGGLGFGVYIFLFVSIFYFGLKWLGFIHTPAERNLFIALWLIGGLVAALGFGWWRGWNFIGVALPFGMMLGFLIFLVVNALRARTASSPDAAVSDRALWLTALIAAFIAHFIEIHFGIAIVATRTYFWFYAALLVVVGMNQMAERATTSTATPAAPPTHASARRHPRRRTVEPTRAKETEPSPAPVIAWTAVATIILVTLAYEFITNQAGAASALQVVQTALFTKGQEASYGIFFLITFTWLIAGILALNEGIRAQMTHEARVFEVALFVVLSFTAVLWFVLLQTRWLIQPGDLTDSLIALLGWYYVALFFLVGALAFALTEECPRAMMWVRAPVSVILAPLLVAGLAGAIYTTNVSSITADIVYKAGTNYDALGAWDYSIGAYQRARALQPMQDFYALFLGRAYLEGGRAATNPTMRATMISTSEKILLEARQLNPLNTDHSANLARLHRIVAAMTDDPKEKAERLQKSSQYYQDATRLSPNTAYLYNEWSQTYTLAGDLEQARAKLEKSLQLDQKYGQTYAYLGEYYRSQGDVAAAGENYLQAIALDASALSEPNGTLMSGPAQILTQPEYLARAADAYRTFAERNPQSLAPYYALADLYKRAGQLDHAREVLERGIQVAPNDWTLQLALVNLLSETGQIDAAVNAMRRVMELVQPSRPDYRRFQDFYTQLQVLQRDLQAVQQAPTDVNARRTLAARWKARGQPQFALKEYAELARLAPNDYDAHKNLVLLNLQVNQIDAAQRALVTAVSLAPEGDKPLWQNILAALNAHKAGQLDAARQAAQAALALASDTDKPALQAYVSQLQRQLPTPQ